MKRIACIILCILMIGCLDFAVNAKETFGHHFFEYWIEDGGIQICGYLGEETEVTIPNSISGLPVYAIVNGAFSDCPSVQILNVPDTVTEIEEGAISANIAVNYLGNTYMTKNEKPAEEASDMETIEPDPIVQESGVTDGADDGFEETVVGNKEEDMNNGSQEEIIEDNQDDDTHTDSDDFKNAEATEKRTESKDGAQRQIIVISCLAVILLAFLLFKFFKKKRM